MILDVGLWELDLRIKENLEKIRFVFFSGKENIDSRAENTANAQAYYKSLGCKTDVCEGRKSILS